MAVFYSEKEWGEVFGCL